MDLKLVILLVGTTLQIASAFELMPSACEELCPKLVSRLQLKEVKDVKGVKDEMSVICNEKSSVSEAMCDMFIPMQVTKVLQSASKLAVDDICSDLCSLTPPSGIQLGVPLLEDPDEEELPKVNDSSAVYLPRNKGNQRCTWCKEKVRSCVTIATLLHLSFENLAETLCPLLKSDLRSVVLCRSITSNMRGHLVDSKFAESNICSAIDHCDVDKNDRTCPFSRLQVGDSRFETAFNLVSLFAQRLLPNAESGMAKLRATFLVLDETAKCFSPDKNKKSLRRESRGANTYCRAPCDGVPELISQEMHQLIAPLHFFKMQFKEFCSEIKDTKLKQRCHTLHHSVNAKAILDSLFRKQICESFDCNILNAYPLYRCQFCKFSVQRQNLKDIVRYGIETLTTIEEGTALVCTMMQDQRCEQFLDAQRKLLGTIKSMTSENEICTHMGFCSKL